MSLCRRCGRRHISAEADVGHGCIIPLESAGMNAISLCSGRDCSPYEWRIRRASSPAKRKHRQRAHWFLFRSAAPLLAMLLLGCGGANPESTAATTPALSAELRNATADFNHTLAWAKHYFGVGEAVQLEAEGIELVPGGPRALFLSNPTNSENGNPTHLVFQLWPCGFKYMGKLGYAAYRAVPVDALQQPRVVIYWQLTNDQGRAAFVHAERSGV